MNTVLKYLGLASMIASTACAGSRASADKFMYDKCGRDFLDYNADDCRGTAAYYSRQAIGLTNKKDALLAELKTRWNLEEKDLERKLKGIDPKNPNDRLLLDMITAVQDDVTNARYFKIKSADILTVVEKAKP